MIISISGNPGSGKSTVAKKLSAKLGYKHYYIGILRRQAAQEKGMTLDEYNKLGETDFSTDKNVDEYLKKLGETEDNFVVESRTAFHFIPQSLKIFLTVDEKEGAKRIFSDLKLNPGRNNEGRRLNTVDDVATSNKERMLSDQLRYKKYYNLDLADPKNFDLVLDSSHLSIKDEFNKVWEYVRSKIA